MPRGGWKSAPVFDCWVQIVRSRTGGPKLASKQSVLETPSAVSQPRDSTKQKWDVPLLQAPKATEKVHRLEAALSALGEGNQAFGGPSNCPFQGQTSSSGGANHCKNFVERARKRVSRVEAVISRALEQKVVFEKEVQEGELRLQQLEESQSQRTDATQNRRFDTRTRFSEGGHPESASRRMDGQSSSQFLQSPCLLCKTSKDC